MLMNRSSSFLKGLNHNINLKHGLSLTRLNSLNSGHYKSSVTRSFNTWNRLQASTSSSFISHYLSSSSSPFLKNSHLNSVLPNGLLRLLDNIKGFEHFEKDYEKKQNESKDNKDNKDSKDKKTKTPEPPKNDIMNYLLATLLVYAAINALSNSGESGEEISWQEFKKKYLAAGVVDKLDVINKKIVRVVQSKRLENQSNHVYFTISSVTNFEQKVDDAVKELKLDPNSAKILYHSETSVSSVLINFAPVLLFIGGMIWIYSRFSNSSQVGNILNDAKSKATLINPENIRTKFADVAGMDEAKQEIMEFVNFLKNPAMYKELGAKVPKGAIIFGPPGVGKTLLAKATAGEAGVPFFSTSGSEFQELFVGVGPGRVRDLFAKAKASAPSIIFIDEIDAIGKARNQNSRFVGNDERENTLNQILVEMDGFDTSNEGVIVLAGTNRVDVLDPALLRPGRFDRQIAVDRPDVVGREAIFKVHLKKILMKDNVDEIAKYLSNVTPGFSGADIANVCNEAALIAGRNNADHVTKSHFEAAIERVIGGLEKKTKVLSPEEKKIVAYHEAGHAIAGWFLKHARPLLKVSIIPRGSAALGYAMQVPKDQYLYSTEELFDILCVTLGGRVSEKIFFDHLSTGAQDDLKKITQLAYSQIVTFGMNKNVGQISFDLPGDDDPMYSKPYSEETSQLIDEEAKQLIQKAFDTTYELLLKHKDDVEKVAKTLLEKEVLKYEDMVNLVGKRPYEEIHTHLTPDSNNNSSSTETNGSNSNSSSNSNNTGVTSPDMSSPSSFIPSSQAEARTTPPPS